MKEIYKDKLVGVWLLIKMFPYDWKITSVMWQNINFTIENLFYLVRKK